MLFRSRLFSGALYGRRGWLHFVVQIVMVFSWLCALDGLGDGVAEDRRAVVRHAVVVVVYVAESDAHGVVSSSIAAKLYNVFLPCFPALVETPVLDDREACFFELLNGVGDFHVLGPFRLLDSAELAGHVGADVLTKLVDG